MSGAPTAPNRMALVSAPTASILGCSGNSDRPRLGAGARRPAHQNLASRWRTMRRPKTRTRQIPSLFARSWHNFPTAPSATGDRGSTLSPFTLQMLIWSGRSPGHAAYSSCRVLPVARARTRSPKLGVRAPASSPVALLVADLGGRLRPCWGADGDAFASAAEADLRLLPAGSR